jgi:molybdopterin synthase catalytic subunit
MITDQPIHLEDRLSGLLGAESGAVVVFAGVVRADVEGGRKVTRIHYDCYREMAEREMARLTEEIRASTGVHAIMAVHRVGDVPVGEISLLVVVTAGHRSEAYDASRRAVDEIKLRVPLWKKEIYDDGSSRWI